MAFNPQAGPSSHAFLPSSSFPQYSSSSRLDLQPDNSQFDILEWYPSFLSCHKYFLDHAQHQYPVQALAAFVNIQLPYQKQPSIMSTSSSRAPAEMPHPRQPNAYSQAPSAAHPHAVSLIPYIRRLIATGHDTDAILHGFFGDTWPSGIGPLHEIERRNFLFAAKSTGWLKVKEAYDMGPDETIPFLSSLANASEKEIQAAETKWSEWLAMQDWMLGPRSPEISRGQQEQRFKRESSG